MFGYSTEQLILSKKCLLSRQMAPYPKEKRHEPLPAGEQFIPFHFDPPLVYRLSPCVRTAFTQQKRTHHHGMFFVKSEHLVQLSKSDNLSNR